MKFKKSLAVMLSVATVISSISIGNYSIAVAAKEDKTNVVRTTETLRKIDWQILRDNAKANSEQTVTTPESKGGPARWAFNNYEGQWWHSRFSGTPGPGEVASGEVGPNNPIWIQTGFDREKRIKKVTYQPRNDNQGGIINAYELQVANTENPTDDDFRTVKSGNFRNVQTEQAIVLDQAEPATHIRLVAKSVHAKAEHKNYATARVIDVYEVVTVPVNNITLNTDNLPLKINEKATLTATVNPDNATDKALLWSSDASEIAGVDQNGVVTAKKAGNAVITVESTKYPEVKAQCRVVVTRDDTALNEVIKEAQQKKAEADYNEKYTAASKKDFEEALKAALAVQNAPLISVGEAEQAVQDLRDALANLKEKFSVTIQNGDAIEKKYYESGEKVTVVAKPAPKGQKFSHWAMNGTPMCYKESYTFTVLGNVALEMVYVEDSVVIEKKVSVLCNVTYENGKVKFVSEHSVPADKGYRVVRTGVVATDSAGYQEIQKAGDELKLDTTATKRLKKYGMDTNYYLFRFTQRLKSSRATTWYARGYVTYVDAQGVQHTEYSELTQCTVNVK